MRRRSTFAIALATTAALVFTAAALAVLPKSGASFKGTFTGGTNQIKFKVSGDSRKITSFSIQTFGCEGGGGLGGVPYFKVGTISVTSSGKFSRTVHKKYFQIPTTVTVSGKFTKAKRAAGTIKISQTFPPADHVPGNACQTSKLPFTATTH
jgi:hypothetical protein